MAGWFLKCSIISLGLTMPWFTLPTSRLLTTPPL